LDNYLFQRWLGLSHWQYLANGSLINWAGHLLRCLGQPQQKRRTDSARRWTTSARSFNWSGCR
jgi:hypothetical protein